MYCTHFLVFFYEETCPCILCITCQPLTKNVQFLSILLWRSDEEDQRGRVRVPNSSIILSMSIMFTRWLALANISICARPGCYIDRITKPKTRGLSWSVSLQAYQEKWDGGGGGGGGSGTVKFHVVLNRLFKPYGKIFNKMHYKTEN